MIRVVVSVRLSSMMIIPPNIRLKRKNGSPDVILKTYRIACYYLGTTIFPQAYPTGSDAARRGSILGRSAHRRGKGHKVRLRMICRRGYFLCLV